MHPRAEYMRQWHKAHPESRRKHQRNQRDRVESAIATYKLEVGCADCGYNTDPAALDFDHVRGTKIGSITSMRRSLYKVLDEIEKCEVVCANCHRIRTAERAKEA